MSRVHKLRVVVVVVTASLFGAGCAPEPIIGTFTSQVVQLETCRSVGDAPEGCARDEAIAALRVDIVEADENTFWLYGLTRGGVDDRAVLGTRDAQGGFLFVDESSQADRNTGCALTNTLELSLAVEPGRLKDVGNDDCIALVGRQIETTATTAQCDTASVPPQPVVRIVRERWEPLDETAVCAE